MEQPPKSRERRRGINLAETGHVASAPFRLNLFPIPVVLHSIRRGNDGRRRSRLLLGVRARYYHYAEQQRSFDCRHELVRGIVCPSKDFSGPNGGAEGRSRFGANRRGSSVRKARTVKVDRKSVV